MICDLSDLGREPLGRVKGNVLRVERYVHCAIIPIIPGFDHSHEWKISRCALGSDHAKSTESQDFVPRG